MYRKCTTEKTAFQQQMFYSALREALKTRDYEDISVTSLCEQTGLSRKTFYRLFDCKDDVLCALLDAMIHEMYLQQETIHSMEEELLRIFRYWKAQRDILDYLEKGRRSTLLLERAFLYVSREDFMAYRAMDVVNHPRRQEIFLFLLSGIMGLIINWHHTGFLRTEEEMAQLSSEILLKPPIRLDAMQ